MRFLMSSLVIHHSLTYPQLSHSINGCQRSIDTIESAENGFVGVDLMIVKECIGEIVNINESVREFIADICRAS